MSEKRVTVWVQRFPDRPYLQLQWLDPDTGQRKTKSSGTADEKDAEKARGDLEYELTHGKYQEASRMTWERFRELFEEEYAAGLRPKTRTRYEDVLNLFEELCHPARLKSVSERTVSTFAAAMRQRPTRGRDGMMPSTIRVNLQFLHTALNWAVEQKMIPGCPKFPTVKVPRKKPQSIPAESFERLYLKAEGDANLQAYLLCGWLAGLRLGEGLELEWEESEKSPWLDLARDRIVLPAEFAKSVEDQWLPLDPVLRRALEALPRHGKKVFRFVAKDGHAITLNGVSERIIRLAKKACVKLSMHSLRKGFGCHYAANVSAHVLQRLMRHANIATTMSYYANIDAAVEEAVKGRYCNSSRNTQPVPALAPAPAAEAIPVATPYQQSK